ncbi:hypothetical protein [Haloarchaeobius litoreus]|uniref:Ribbon-helix-helix protein, copG family n=1 Tax=Haloarchaeobius litoreus TaxID=755306 RepID=A0ABD6DHT3_9EURY|nr:hypothetical protein [Haloarchaeobius litoreus]
MTCIVCGGASTTDHHTSYEPERTVRVCRPCHYRIHNEPGFRDDLEPDESRPDSYETAEKATISARIPEGLNALVDGIAGDRGISKTNAVIEALDEWGTDQSDGSPGNGDYPDDPQLADAYRLLLDNRQPDSGTIKPDAAETVVAEQSKVPKPQVRAVILDPLEDDDYLSYRWGTITVHDPSDRNSNLRSRESSIRTLTRSSGTGRCLGHHPNSEGTRCLKCDADLDPDEYGENRCDCGVTLDKGEERCPGCRFVDGEVTA